MIVRPFLALLVMLASTPAAGSPWQRHILSGKGESFDTPVSHSLAYFTENALSRDDGDDFCSDCSPQGKSANRAKHNFKTTLTKIGEIRGYTVYDLFYSFGEHTATEEIDWKSILVEVSPGRFREIFHLQPIQAVIKPAFFINAGKDELLATHDLIPGTGNNYYEDYWWFSPEGPVRINIDSISDALKSILPNGFGVWKGGGLDMKALTFSNYVWKPEDANCCPTGGSVEIKFRLEDGRLTVISKRYDPSKLPTE